MTVQTRIKEACKERGWTVKEVARRLGLYSSNLSAMDAGTRSVSLRLLSRIAEFLDCSLGDLLEVAWGAKRDPFGQSDLALQLKMRDLGTPDGLERQWVHNTLLSWQRHYQTARPRREA